jgi:hypothetical protein
LLGEMGGDADGQTVTPFFNGSHGKRSLTMRESIQCIYD